MLNVTVKYIMDNFSGFFNMSGRDIILLSAAAALLLIEGLNADQQRTLGDFLTCVGQNILAASDQNSLRENKENKLEQTKNADKTKTDKADKTDGAKNKN